MSGTPPRLSYEDFIKTAPSAYAALGALSKAVADAGLDKAMIELVKVRASQINGCAFCLQYHINAARKLGVAAAKLDLVSVWREAGVYSEREMAALAWSEALTLEAANGATDANYTALLQHFDEPEALFLTVAIGTINQWNRIAGALRFAPLIARGSGERVQ